MYTNLNIYKKNNKNTYAFIKKTFPYIHIQIVQKNINIDILIMLLYIFTNNFTNLKISPLYHIYIYTHTHPNTNKKVINIYAFTNYPSEYQNISKFLNS